MSIVSDLTAPMVEDLEDMEYKGWDTWREKVRFAPRHSSYRQNGENDQILSYENL